ncbi:MAG: hypothetical protein CL927_01485 [Deltaproteobacteria bacterium]|nr:hypothetical protein [Deltaproteobacteria bacterium]HCH65920.1 hypothetical protein [Deltaproteobacteria bacterium]
MTVSTALSTHFCTDPQELVGCGGAYMRGETSIPNGAIWLPRVHTMGRQIHWPSIGLTVVSTVVILLLVDGWWGILPLALWAGLRLRTLWRNRRSQKVTAHAGHHGVLLLDDHLVYRIENDCALVLRNDITGIERRKGTGHGVTGAFTLAGRTGRGALPCPQPGPAAIRQLDAWLRSHAR